MEKYYCKFAEVGVLFVYLFYIGHPIALTKQKNVQALKRLCGNLLSMQYWTHTSE